MVMSSRFSVSSFRIVTFHICCNFLGILGQHFGDAGLKDLFIEIRVVAAGSIAGVLNEHHYNSAVYEALLAENSENVFDQHPAGNS